MSGIFVLLGTHWTWEVVNMLKKGKAEYVSKGKEDFMLEIVDCESFEKLQSPRFINTHLLYETLPNESIQEKKPKMIFVYRNPKDLVVSAYSFLTGWKVYNGTFGNFLKLFMADACKLTCYN